MTERWLPIAGFPHYEVSDHGRVRSLDRIVLRPHRNGTLVAQPRRGKILKPGFDNGYPMVVLCDGTYIPAGPNARRLPAAQGGDA